MSPDDVHGLPDNADVAVLLCLQVDLQQVQGVGAAGRPGTAQTAEVPLGQTRLLCLVRHY